MAFKIEDCRILLRRKKGQTITAILVTAPFFGGEDEWIPWACVHDDSEIYNQGDQGMLLVTDSWAEKKGWE
jgi:hypothetical protein